MDSLIPDRRVRKTIYLIAGAVLTVAGVWGLLEADQVEEISKAVASLLGVAAVGTAVANTPSEKAKYSDDSEGPDAEAEQADRDAEDAYEEVELMDLGDESDKL